MEPANDLSPSCSNYRETISLSENARPGSTHLPGKRQKYLGDPDALSGFVLPSRLAANPEIKRDDADQDLFKERQVELLVHVRPDK